MDVKKSRGRLMKIGTFSAIGITCVLSGQYMQTAQPNHGQGGGDKTMKLVAEYKDNVLLDMSADGKLLLFYQIYDEVLRVVEREGAQEVSRTATHFFPLDEKLIPGKSQVFYSERLKKTAGPRLYKVWDFVSGETRVCFKGGGGDFRRATFLNQHEALGTIWEDDKDHSTERLLGRLSFPQCTRRVVGAIDPDDSNGAPRGDTIVVSPDKGHLVYGLRSNDREILVRETATLNVVRRIKAPSELFFENPMYSPDGKYLLVFACNVAYTEAQIKRYLFFYDTRDYSLVRQLDVSKSITGDSGPAIRVGSSLDSNAMAISPDSRVLAVAHEERKEVRKLVFYTHTGQAFVTLYSLETGEEIAMASYPQLNYNHSDPFAAKISHLAFTPDGKYLLSSTYDTRVWQIDRPSK